MDEAIAGRIRKLRTGLLAFRYLYYCQAQSLISDFEYDAREFELRALVDANPDIASAVVYAAVCPTKTVGSDSILDYPDEIMDLAERLSYIHDKTQNGFVAQKHTTEELISALDELEKQLAVSLPVTQSGLFT